jgi:hypothetical protein
MLHVDWKFFAEEWKKHACRTECLEEVLEFVLTRCHTNII